nr:hypothetical protein [Escherichia coli]
MTFSVGRSAPGRWLTHPKERHELFGIFGKKSPQSGNRKLKSLKKRDSGTGGD